jgi:predicted phosphodiesterase
MKKNNFKNIKIILGTLFLLVNIAFSQSITKKPYLVLPGETEMVIRVETDSKVNCSVNYGVTKNELSQNVKGTLRGVKENYYLYQFLLNNLKSDVKYYYQVLVGDKKSKVSHFTTFDKKEKNIHFVAMGDSRSNPDIFETIMQTVEKTTPNFMISMGDLVREGGKFNEWDKYFFDITKNVISSTPIISALGDHEGNDDNGELFRHYLLTDEPLKKQWFSFNYGDAHFIALDYRCPDSKEMIEWFINDITKSDARWKFVFMHRPSYNFSGHQSRWGFDKWPELFRKYKIDIVFAGHSHIYERFFPMMPLNEEDSWAVTYITTGGAGAGLYNETCKYKSLAAAASINHFVDVLLSGDTLKLRTIKSDNTLFDSLTIIKQGDKQSKEYLGLVLDQNEVNLQSSFIAAISLSLDYVPLGSNRTPGVDLLFNSTVNMDIPFTLELTEESAKYYKMESANGVLPANGEVKIHLHPRGGITDYVSVHKWGELDPPLQIKMVYKYAGKDETLISVPAKYWY